MTKLSSGPRDASAELLRILAAFFVVMIHVSATETGIAIAYNAFARFSVPLFILLSGRFLLSKERSIPEVFRKGGRLLAMMVVWSALYYGFFTLMGSRPDLPIWKYLLTEPVHLWYLWAAAALYLMTPVLYVFCSHASKAVYQYTLVGTFLLGSILFILLRSEFFPLLAEIVDQAKLPYQLGFVFCFLLGDYTSRFPLKRPAPVGWTLFLLASLVNVGANLWLAETSVSTLLLSFFTPASLLAGAGLYWAVQGFALPGSTAKWVRSWSACTLGIYLAHPMLLHLLTPWRSALGFPAIVEVPLVTILVFALSSLLVFLFRKIFHSLSRT